MEETLHRYAPLRILKAAAASIPFVRCIELGAGPRPSSGCRFLRLRLDALLTDEEQRDQTIGNYLVEVARDLQAAVAGTSRLSANEQPGFDRLIALLESRAAADATGSDTSPGRSVAICIPEIQDAFAFAEDLAKRLLQPEGLALPPILRATSVESELEACRRSDTVNGLANEVTFQLPSRGFSREQLYGAPYVLAHEMICHAAQGVKGPFPRRDSGPGCAWSDGWMDCLALEETEGHLLGDAPLPGWVDEGGAAIMRAARRQHQERDQPGSPGSKGVDLDARLEAQEAWEALRLAAVDAGLSDDEASALRRSFSLRYNAHNIPPATRGALVTGLWTNLNSGAASEAMVVAAVQAFVASDDLAELHQAIVL